MNNEDVLQRNDAGELEVRTAPSTGDTGTNKDDVYTRDEQGRLCVRTTSSGGGSTTPTAAEVSFDPAGLTSITGDNVQSALEEVDAALSDKVATGQGTESAGKVLAVDGSGNVVPTAGYATESWVNQQIQTQIGTIETALAEV